MNNSNSVPQELSNREHLDRNQASFDLSIHFGDSQYMKQFDEHRVHSFHPQTYTFPRPADRNMLSPMPFTSKDYLQSSPLAPPISYKNYHAFSGSDLPNKRYSSSAMLLDITPFKPDSKKQSNRESQELLDFSPYEEDEGQQPPEFQTPARAPKPENSLQPQTAHTTRSAPVNPSFYKHSFEVIKEEQYSPMASKAANTKGLRALAEDVNRIVDERKQTTYKEVAELQIQKMEAEGKISKNSKDAQNVKRRVYDALNVLISAGVLARDGKIVSVDPNLSKANSKTLKADERDRLQEQIFQIQNNIRDKQAKLRLLEKKYLAELYLVSRNRETLVKDPEVRRIPFPLLVLVSKPGHNKCRLLRKTLRISSKDPNGLKMMGDLDVLVEMGFHNKLPNRPNFLAEHQKAF